MQPHGPCRNNRPNDIAFADDEADKATSTMVTIVAEYTERMISSRLVDRQFVGTSRRQPSRETRVLLFTAHVDLFLLANFSH